MLRVVRLVGSGEEPDLSLVDGAPVETRRCIDRSFIMAWGHQGVEWDRLRRT